MVLFSRMNYKTRHSMPLINDWSHMSWWFMGEARSELQSSVERCDEMSSVEWARLCPSLMKSLMNDLNSNIWWNDWIANVQSKCNINDCKTLNHSTIGWMYIDARIDDYLTNKIYDCNSSQINTDDMLPCMIDQSNLIHDWGMYYRKIDDLVWSLHVRSIDEFVTISFMFA